MTEHSQPRRSVRRRVTAVLIAALSAALAAAPSFASTPRSAQSPPDLSVAVLESGLEVPWDLAFLDADRYLLLERPGRLWLASTTAGVPRRAVAANFSDLSLIASGGAMGMVLDPQFSANRLFYTCQTHNAPRDVRVVRWRLSADGTRAWRVSAPVLQGITYGSPHFGCRLLFQPDGTLLVGTGDAGSAVAPQQLDNLAGKILRVRRDGSVPRDNPWAGSRTKRKYVWNYGHRNVQGLALRPGTAQVFSAEHGPDRDDEVNVVRKARNYGWDPRNPAGGPGYYQDVPMTDLTKFPGAVRAAWSSGYPTVATSGMTFVSGSGWGEYDGAAFVALLKGAGVLSLRFAANGSLISSARVPQLEGTYGRLRTVRQGPDGAVYVLTANGSDDKVVRVRPGT